MKKLLFLLVLLSCYSCWLDPFHDKKDGEFLKDVVPLTEFNSEYDDYNSNLASNKYGEIDLTFSSKRIKKDFLNLVNFQTEFKYDKRLSLQKFVHRNQSDVFDDISGPTEGYISRANGDFNVYGPKSLSFMYDLVSRGNVTGAPAKGSMFFYADDSEGNMEIKYMINNEKGIEGPFKFDLLNSPKDDGYPSFSFDGDKIYFSSNRDGNFDIYELSTPPVPQTESPTVETLIHPKTYTLRKMEEFSSPQDDKTPYFQDNTMVFVSDRPGGKGGFDIYYSKLENGKWSQPVNAGDRINTSNNEYRPILPNLNNFSYNLMIFSSDRPGGKGGFDLYMTGLTKKW
ncbi:hypothetical protein [Dyadobacter sp. CY323]|uniref:TolB family protein n=1 Tax=Dyadobacter sp. CY323 TaxID=2907302 RepID=UPI001F4139B5|nr:hypothetical protein [Dyadobacter sp. CY323]MCE6988023.1 hypothetical protein [Dyadobacter sp. CY323]